MTIITNARFPGSARRVDIAIKGGAIAAITPAGSLSGRGDIGRLPDLGDGNRRRGDWA